MDLKAADVSPFTYIAFEFASHFVRYFVLTLAAYFFIWKRASLIAKKIDPKSPPKKQIRFEITQSLQTMFVFSLWGGTVFYLNHHYGLFQFYAGIRDHGLAYFILSPFILVIFHDAYFYWTHRFMHHPKVFKAVHRVHHQSYSPTPFTSYSFHFFETLIEAAYVPIFTLFLPVHPYALVVVLIYSYVMNLNGHLGYELYGKWFWNSWLSEVFTTATYHHYHHLGGPRSNFGFYFRLWDRLCKTEDPRYLKVIEQRRTSQPIVQAHVPAPDFGLSSDHVQPSHSSLPQRRHG